MYILLKSSRKLDHKTSLNKFQKIKIIHRVLCDHDRVRKNKKTLINLPCIWKLKYILLKTPQKYGKVIRKSFELNNKRKTYHSLWEPFLLLIPWYSDPYILSMI